MASLNDLRDEFDAAFKEEFRAKSTGHVPDSVKWRLIEATRALHSAEDPWNDCLCYFCMAMHM